MTSTQARASNLIPLPDKGALLKVFEGQPLSALPTPALVIDRAVIKRNAQRMASIAEAWQTSFRAHIKTHKTAEGVRLMLEDHKGSPGGARIVVSTLAEAWGVLDSGLIKDGTVQDILYGLPVGPHKIPELHELRSLVHHQSPSRQAHVRVLVDHEDQVAALEKFAVEQTSSSLPPWSVMVKVETGYNRAGIDPTSDVFLRLLKRISACQQVRLYGFYAHAGHSYSSKSPTDADSFLTLEVRTVNEASEVAHKIIPSSTLPDKLVLSVGSTPTAHAASRAPSSETVQKLKATIKGELELHAGNYPFLDLQQLATKAIPGLTASQDSAKMEDVAISMVCTVVSSYTGRGQVGQEAARVSQHTPLACQGDEALVDGGGTAFSKDTGPWGGYGHVTYPSALRGWQLGRVAQEHGVLTLRDGTSTDWMTQWIIDDSDDATAPRKPKVGEKVRVVPQHACMACAAHNWFYIVDSDQQGTAHRDAFDEKVIDVWVPWKGW